MGFSVQRCILRVEILCENFQGVRSKGFEVNRGEVLLQACEGLDGCDRVVIHANLPRNRFVLSGAYDRCQD